MPIISGNRFQKKEKIKAEINSETFDKIVAYCDWANIDNISHFIEEAAAFVFKQDREWKKLKRQAKKRNTETTSA